MWILRSLGVAICAWSIFELVIAFRSTHFELGASRRHLVFDLQHGYAHYTAGIMMLIAASILGMLMSLLQVFTSEVGQRRYRLACKVVGGVSIATIVLAYLAQVWRF
jgi:hypothetical protein